MGRAKKGLHLDCPACGARLVVDHETGEVVTYASPPASGSDPGGSGSDFGSDSGITDDTGTTPETPADPGGEDEQEEPEDGLGFLGNW